MLTDGQLFAGLPFADKFLQAANGLIRGVQAYYADAMKDLMEEWQLFLDFRDEVQKQLEDANKLLANQNFLSPITIFGETPDNFFNRTVHSGNIGALSIGAISYYVDNALTLPKLADTLGDRTYVV